VQEKGNADRFLVDARDIADVQTTHRAYTMVEGVLLAFRRRLSLRDALMFANEPTLLLRALFVSSWGASEASTKSQLERQSVQYAR
jgi:uncharacterized protein (DUF2267 family)